MKKLILLFLLIPTMAFSEPAITNTSGTVTHGQSIVLSGSSFGNKTTAVPIKWDDFEWGGNEDVIYGIGGWVRETETNAGPYISTTQKYAGTRSAYNTISTANQFSTVALDFESALEVYMSYMLYWECASGTCNGVFKLSRINSVTHYSGAPGIKVQYQPSASWLYANYLDGANELSSKTIAPGILTQGEWYRVEMYIKLSNPGGSTNGIAYIAINGVITNVLSGITRVDGNSALLNNILLPFMWANSDGTQEIYVDDVYLDNTQARVELCDSSLWTARSHCEIQIPSAWSTTEITATLNQGSFADGQNVYLYVVDADGSVNSNGYLTHFGTVTSHGRIKIGSGNGRIKIGSGNGRIKFE
jgi:hypothetical protein